MNVFAAHKNEKLFNMHFICTAVLTDIGTHQYQWIFYFFSHFIIYLLTCRSIVSTALKKNQQQSRLNLCCAVKNAFGLVCLHRKNGLLLFVHKKFLFLSRSSTNLCVITQQSTAFFSFQLLLIRLLPSTNCVFLQMNRAYKQ